LTEYKNESLGTAASDGPTVQTPDDDNEKMHVEHYWNGDWQGINKLLRRSCPSAILLQT
jgi:hypothetical protein